MKELPHNFEQTPWESLLLDAEAELPNVGVAMVLAYTALEVLIEKVWDELGSERVKPQALWKWFNDRYKSGAKPSMADRFDRLLQVLTGESLKREASLWRSFKCMSSAEMGILRHKIRGEFRPPEAWGYVG